MTPLIPLFLFLMLCGSGAAHADIWTSEALDKQTNRQLPQLERIANALERIATALEQKKEKVNE